MKHNLQILDRIHAQQKYHWPIILLLFVLALFTSGALRLILLLLSFIFIAYYAMRVYARIREPWCKIHFPAMVRWNAVCGVLMGAQTNSQWREMLQMYTNSIFQDMSPPQAEQYVSSALNKLSHGYDGPAIRELLLRKQPPLPESRITHLIEDQLAHFAKEDNYAMQLKAVIAQIVEDTYGLEERKKYIRALLANEAF